MYVPKNMSSWFMDDLFAKFASQILKFSLIKKIDMIYINRFQKKNL